MHEMATEDLLALLAPLQKPHYSYPLPYRKFSDKLLLEYARLTGAVCLSGEWATDEEIDRAVRVCQETGATIGVNHSPWVAEFKDLPPTDVGQAHNQALGRMRSRLEFIAQRINGRVGVSAVLFDTEVFHRSDDDSDWNAALTAKYDAAYDLASEIFSEAVIEWYHRGAVQPSASESGWSESSNFILDERGDSLGCSLYRVPEIETTRATFRRTAENARKHQFKSVTPWIALAAGYRRSTQSFQKFSLDWDYDLEYTWLLGAEVNQPWFNQLERFAPWGLAKRAIFYPEPFGRSPHWAKHFVAYVLGANGRAKNSL